MWKKLCLAQVLVFSAQARLPPVVGQDVVYNVKPGQNLSRLAEQWGLGLEHVTFANRMPVELEARKKRRLLLPGRRILPRERPATGLVINLPERGAYLFLKDRYAGFFPLAIGTLDRKTPQGHFKINSMMKNPTWFPPAWAEEETPVLPGPANPLGDRWMGVNSPGLGLHATNQPGSVGGSLSHGCMRTYPRMAKQLFELVHKGMPVWIIYEPVKFGIDRRGRLNVQVFPDVYRHNNSRSRAQKVLERERIRVPQATLRQWVSRPDGVTRVVAESEGLGTGAFEAK